MERIAQGSYRVRARWTCLKTGRRKELDRIVAAHDVASAAQLRVALIREAKTASDASERLRVEAHAISWLRTKVPSLKASTRKTYSEALDLYILPAFGEFYLDSVTRDDIVAWRDSMPGAPDSVNGRLRVLKTMFADAAAERRVPHDPAAKVPFVRKRQKGDASKGKTLTGAELRSLLAAVKTESPRWYPVILTMATTGARFGTVSALQWPDIDFENATIHFRRSQWRGIIDTTKTGPVRTVPLAPELASVLRGHRRALVAAQAPGLKEGWVFPTQVGTLPYQSSLTKPLRKAAVTSGLAVRRADGSFEGKLPSAHWFRHTWNNLLRQVAQGEVVRSLTGHVTREMTEHYSHVELEEKRVAVDAVLRLVSPANGGTEGGT